MLNFALLLTKLLTFMKETFSIGKGKIPTIYYTKTDKPKQTIFCCLNLHNYFSQNIEQIIKTPHKHEFFEIIWIKNGEGSHIINFEEHSVTNNTIYFLTPGKVHSFHGIGFYTGFCLSFSKNVLLYINKDVRNLINSQIFDEYNGSLSCKVDETNKQIILRDFNILEEEYLRFKETNYQDINYIASLLSIFLLDTLRFCHWNKEIEHAPLQYSYQTYQKFISLVEENFKMEHRVRFYTDKLSVSLSSLTNYTKLYTGLTPAKIIERRLTLEATILKNSTDLSLKDIASTLSFEDVSNFSKFLKRNFNTPFTKSFE